MQETSEETPQNELVDVVFAQLQAEETASLQQQLDQLHEAEIANLLESLPPEERRAVWKLVPDERKGDTLSFLREEARASIIDVMDAAQLVATAEAMEVTDLAAVIEELPEDVTETIVRSLDSDRRHRLEATLTFEEGTAGRLMSRDVVSVRNDVTLAVVLRYLRRHASLPPHTDALMVIDEEGRYLGRLPMANVVTGDPDSTVALTMQPHADWVLVDASEHDVAVLFERRDLISVAVLDADNRLVGRITVDDIVDIIREEADRALLSSAGLHEEEDLFAPVVPSAQRRAVWLGINLVTVLLAAWVIGRFEQALDQIVALAVLLPVVASMGGIAGSQTLTLTIRGQALGQIASANVRWLTTKEFLVGALNGLAWAAVVGLVTQLWFRDLGISLVIGTAMVINLLAAAISGVLIPLVLKRFGVDPALSGAVVLTTVTDIVGFMSFLGLATLFLL